MGDRELEPSPKPNDPVQDRYVDVFFDVSDLHIFPRKGELFEITDDLRLGRTLTVLSEKFPSFTVSPETRKQVLSSRKSYLGSRLVPGDKSSKKRGEVVNIGEAYATAITLMKGVNHPAIQLAEQIDKRHNRDGEHNRELRQLTEDLVTVVMWDDLRTILDEQTSQARKGTASPTLGVLALQSQDSAGPTAA